MITNKELLQQFKSEVWEKQGQIDPSDQKDWVDLACGFF